GTAGGQRYTIRFTVNEETGEQTFSKGTFGTGANEFTVNNEEVMSQILSLSKDADKVEPSAGNLIIRKDGEIEGRVAHGTYEGVEGYTVYNKYDGRNPERITTVSDDGKTRITETYDYGIDLNGDGKIQGSDEKNARTSTGWEKTEEIDRTVTYREVDHKIKVVEKTTRKYEQTDKGADNTKSYTDHTVDSTTGQPQRITITKDGKTATVKFTDENGEPLDAPSYEGDETLRKTLEEEYANEHGAWTSKTVFSAINYVLTEFQGLGFYSRFLDDENMARWREGVDEFFSESIFGIEYWKSGICSEWFDNELDESGVAFMETPAGLATAAAHVEGKISSATEHPNGTTVYLYKVSAFLRLIEEEDGEDTIFNIQLTKGSQTKNLLSENQKIEPGDDWSAAGTDILIVQDTVRYTKACIHFIKRGQFDKYSEDINSRLCNRIR
ncbi:hypothetical protein GOV06_02425, partial [Candidatus Woesearchaeota archaeon]|nr:hypothetical protein [Candidatus Woesearchaeota archaeon]